MRLNRPRDTVLHHTAVSSKNDQFEGVDNHHRKKGYPLSSLGFYVGYHYFIERNGKIIQAREHTDEGAHTLGGWNVKTLAICFAGDFNKEVPTDAQLVAGRALVKKLGMPALLHREADTHRTCPGRFFSKELLTIMEVDEEDQAKSIALQKELDAVKIKLAFSNNFIVRYILSKLI